MNIKFHDNRMNQPGKGAIPITFNMCGCSDGILLNGICWGKQKSRMPHLRKQDSGAKKLDSRFHGNDSAAPELIPISLSNGTKLRKIVVARATGLHHGAAAAVNHRQ